MPTHDYECPACGVFEHFSFMQEPPLKRCPHCRSRNVHKVWTTAPRVRGDIKDWSSENNGKGRYCPQLARHPGDKLAYAKGFWDLIDKGKRRGMEVDKDGDG